MEAEKQPHFPQQRAEDVLSISFYSDRPPARGSGLQDREPQMLD